MPAPTLSLETGQVREIMSSPVHTLRLDDYLSTAQHLFEKNHIHHAVVLEERKVFGVVSDRDVLRAVSPFVGNQMMEREQDAKTLRKRVHQIVSRSLVTIRPEDTLISAARKMRTEHVSSLPVVDDTGALLGIVTSRDLIRWIARHAVSEPRT